MTDVAFHAVIRATYPPTGDDATARVRKSAQARWATLSALFHDAPTQAGVRGTAWAGYQAVVEYVDHYAPIRASNAADAATARALRALTSEDPTRTKQTAWATLTGATS